MGTTSYFDKTVKDAAHGNEFNLEVGKTNFAGEGPQLYLKLGDSHMILSHDDAKEFCEGVADVARYFSYL